MVLTGGGGSGATATADGTVIQMRPKAIQELFELNYGRMNATLGVELPFTNFNTQTTIPLGYVDPATEDITNSDAATQVGSLGDGTQIWKITHNGVDTHAIHFHLFNVQVINRVGWDGAIRPPDPNELGWKETVRMNPLEDAIVALRPDRPDAALQDRRQRPAARSDHARGSDARDSSIPPTATPSACPTTMHGLRLGVRVALPPARPRRERHDAADRVPASRRPPRAG